MRTRTFCIRLTFSSLLLLCSCRLSGLYAQPLSPRNATLTTNNGLPHNVVTGVIQDKAGFIWIATHDGLARYDGRMVKVFRNRPGDTTSLVSNKITQFEKTATGSFFLGNGAGSFQLFDPVTERFTTLLNERFLALNNAKVSQGQLSPDGRHVWGLLPAIRLVDYDRLRKTLRTYDVPTLVKRANEFDDFILTRRGYIYGLSSTGLLQFNVQTGRKRLVPLPVKLPTKVTRENFAAVDNHQIVEGPDGQIVVFAYRTLLLYDPDRNQFRTLPLPDGIGLRPAERKPSPVVHRAYDYYLLRTLANKRLYFGYTNHLFRLDGDRFTPIQQTGPSSEQTNPWLLDQSGVLWVGSASSGLARLDLHALPFQFAPKRKSFDEDLLEQDLGVPTLPDSFVVWPIAQWPRFTLGPHQTGYLIDPVRVYKHTPGHHRLAELTALRIANGRSCCKLCLKVSRQGRIWVYSNFRGLLDADATGRTAHLYPNSQLPNIYPMPGYDAGDIQPLGQSVWVGSRYGLGLFRYDIVRQRFDPPLFTSRAGSSPNVANGLAINRINCLSADPTDSTVLWIGTTGSGLWRLATAGRPHYTYRRLGEAEGFPDGTILSIETDAQGMLWCSTNRGLVRLNPRTLTWRHFTTADGLSEDAFLSTSSAHLPDGRLVFGTPNGRVIFNPAAIRDQHYEPPIVLSALAINNKPVDVNQLEHPIADLQSVDSPLPAPLNTLSELTLNHTQNFLTLTFAALDYARAEKLNYRYKLADVDADWVTVGRQNTANYTQLAPGRYLFSVNSTTADGRWSRQVKQLSIVIMPPFWATWWAYLVYALGFGGLVLGFIRFRTNQLRQRQEIRLKQQEAEQLRAVDEVKTRFFSNITHEFRTPLTLILSPAEKLLEEPKHDAPTRQTIRSIHANAGRLLRLINQLLDISKLEGENMTIALGQGDAVEFIERLVDLFRPMAAIRRITLHLEANFPDGNRLGNLWLFDADKWEKIITNLLSNALKFTPEGGEVFLTIEQLRSADANNEQLKLTIRDTGIGIEDAHIAHIFDRFYQVDDSRTRAYEGTGIGLALVKELTELLGGNITVQSRTGTPTGTTFTITLPLRPASELADAPVVRLPTASPDAAWPIATSTNGTSTAPNLPITDNAPLILVVDDNEELRTFVANELAYHYRVLTAADGEAAWATCQHELPDVVVTDVMMPRMDGYQLTHLLKSTPATNHIAVVLLTAKAAHESRIAGLEQGADDYLTKPFHMDELSLRLTNLLTHQQNLRAYLHRQLSALTVSPQESVVDPFVSQLHQAIESRLDDATFGVDDLAEAAAMSRRTLHRKLTTITNLTANEFIRHYRLRRATQLLQTGLSISETAYQVGFESPSYFTKVFKQTYQRTPSEFVGN